MTATREIRAHERRLSLVRTPTVDVTAYALDRGPRRVSRNGAWTTFWPRPQAESLTLPARRSSAYEFPHRVR
jgi:hypothetical protein